MYIVYADSVSVTICCLILPTTHPHVRDEKTMTLCQLGNFLNVVEFIGIKSGFEPKSDR